MKLWVDTETVGLAGPVKLIQFSVDDGPVQLIRLFKGRWPVEEVKARINLLADVQRIVKKYADELEKAIKEMEPND